MTLLLAPGAGSWHSSCEPIFASAGLTCIPAPLAPSRAASQHPGMQITDPYTASILKGLFEVLLAEGCIVCMTSNRAPWELPRHGLHEDMFTHMISTILTSCQVGGVDGWRWRFECMGEGAGSARWEG